MEPTHGPGDWRQRLDGIVATDAPTTLALAELDAAGAAEYHFYEAGTSAPGLTLAAAEAALRHGVGVTIGPSEDSFVQLFSESAARCLVTVRPGDTGALEAMAGALGVPIQRVGTTGGDALTVEGAFAIPLDELRTAWTSTLPNALG